jgi:hypothetical protein
VRCEECGFDFDSVSPADAPAALRGFGRRYRAPLTRLLAGEDDGLLRVRPEPQVWSAIEYAGHVRDVFALFDRRIAQILGEVDPDLEVVDHDQAVERGGYRQADVNQLAEDLGAGAERLAATVESLGPDQWRRAGWRNGETRTVDEIVRRALHEGHHHLLDIGRVLRAAREIRRS